MQQFSLLINALTQEPYAQAMSTFKSLLGGSEPNMFVHLAKLEELSFERYVELTKQWLKNAHFTWLVQGNI